MIKLKYFYQIPKNSNLSKRDQFILFPTHFFHKITCHFMIKNNLTLHSNVKTLINYVTAIEEISC